MMTKQSGFTLIELMIVVAIIGLIAAIGYPSYQRHMQDARRSEAHVALLRMADLQERFYLQNNTYADAGAEASVGGTSSEAHQDYDANGTPDPLYDLEIVSGDANTYELLATPTAIGPQTNDADCQEIRLTSAGAKTPVECW